MHADAESPLGRRLRELREQRGWSREQLSIATGWTRPPTPELGGSRVRREPVGVSPRTIANVELEGRQPGVDLVKALADALGVKVDDLLVDVAA